MGAALPRCVYNGKTQRFAALTLKTPGTHLVGRLSPLMPGFRVKGLRVQAQGSWGLRYQRLSRQVPTRGARPTFALSLVLFRDLAALHFAALHFAALHFAALHFAALHLAALHLAVLLRCTANPWRRQAMLLS